MLLRGLLKCRGSSPDLLEDIGRPTEEKGHHLNQGHSVVFGLQFYKVLGIQGFTILQLIQHLLTSAIFDIYCDVKTTFNFFLKKLFITVLKH